MLESWKTTCPLDKDQVTKAVKALKEYVAKTQKLEEKTLLEDHDCIHLQVSLHKIPALKRENVYIKLPHTLFRDGTDVCLITKDMDTDRKDVEKSEEHYRDILTKNGITCVTKIMPITQLKLDYLSYESKRKLVDMYELFLCDYPIRYRMPTLLGKNFLNKRKDPWAIKMNSRNLKIEFNEVMSKTRWYMSGDGSSSTMTVAKSTFSVSEIVENVMACAVEVAKHAPRGWNNVRSLSIKTGKSIALPVYYNDNPTDVNEMDMEELKYLQKQKRRRQEKVEIRQLIGLHDPEPYGRTRQFRKRLSEENDESIDLKSRRKAKK